MWNGLNSRPHGIRGMLGTARNTVDAVDNVPTSLSLSLSLNVLSFFARLSIFLSRLVYLSLSISLSRALALSRTILLLSLAHGNRLLSLSLPLLFPAFVVLYQCLL